MWINILNIAFLWRSGNSDLVKQPEIQSWIMFVLYDLCWVYMYFCLPENSLYISFFFFSEKKTVEKKEEIQQPKTPKRKIEQRKMWAF